MHVRKSSCTLMMASLLMLASPAIADQKIDYQHEITSTASYSADSAALSYIQRWLTQNAEYVDGEMIGDPTQLGDVRVQITTAASGLQAASPGDNPPVPLPPSGNPGDVITITSVTAAATQTWTYEWKVGQTFGGWDLIGYTYQENGGGGGPVTDPK